MVQGRYGSISYKSKKNKPKPKDQWVIVNGTHEPIIDINLWNSVQSKINSNFKPFTSGKIGIFAKKCVTAAPICLLRVLLPFIQKEWVLKKQLKK